MAASVHRIEVHYKKDPRLKTRTDRIRSLGIPAEELHLADVYTIATDARDFTREELLQIGSQLMNPVVQECSVDEPTRLSFDYAIEVGFLPGVTDNVGATARQTIEDFFSLKFAEGESVASSQTLLHLRETVGRGAFPAGLDPCKPAREPGPPEDPAGIREYGDGRYRAIGEAARTAGGRNGES